jgi:uncharacterized protein YkwD
MAGSSRRVGAHAMAGGGVRRWLGLPPRSSMKLFGTRPIVGALALVVMVPAVPVRTNALETQQATAIVTGLVVDETGRPVNELDVDVYPWLSRAKTDRTGHFRLTNVPTGQPVTLRFVDFAYFQFPSTFLGGTTDPSDADTFTLDPGETRQLGRIVVNSRLNPTRSAQSIATRSERAVRRAYRRRLQPTIRAETYIAPRGCTVGSTSLARQNRVITAVNVMRNLVGVDSVTLDTRLSAKARKAALIQHYQGFLSHFPDPSARCYTKAGADGASHSNLAYGPTGADVVLLYMADWGDSNRPVGHRRWIHSPSTETMGTNQVGIFNALYVVGETSDENPSPPWLRWPSAGYFPAQLEPNGRWSFSATRSRDVNLDQANVVVRSGGRKLAIRKYPPTGGYGYQTTLTWDFKQRIVVRPGATRTFRVTITGIRQRGLVLPAQTYTVRLFHA